MLRCALLLCFLGGGLASEVLADWGSQTGAWRDAACGGHGRLLNGTELGAEARCECGPGWWGPACDRLSSDVVQQILELLSGKEELAGELERALRGRRLERESHERRRVEEETERRRNDVIVFGVSLCLVAGGLLWLLSYCKKRLRHERLAARVLRENRSRHPRPLSRDPEGGDTLAAPSFAMVRSLLGPPSAAAPAQRILIAGPRRLSHPRSLRLASSPTPLGRGASEGPPSYEDAVAAPPPPYVPKDDEEEPPALPAPESPTTDGQVNPTPATLPPPADPPQGLPHQTAPPTVSNAPPDSSHQS